MGDIKLMKTFFSPGQGFLCHLSALKQLAVSQGQALHSLYTHRATATINHHVITSSSLASPSLVTGGYAPVVPDGFGIAYGCKDFEVRCNASSYLALDVEDFVKCIYKSLEDIFAVLEGKPIS